MEKMVGRGWAMCMRQMWGVSVHEQVLSHTVDDLGNADADSGSYSGACDGDCYVNMNITSTQIYIYIYMLMLLMITLMAAGWPSQWSKAEQPLMFDLMCRLGPVVPCVDDMDVWFIGA